MNTINESLELVRGAEIRLVSREQDLDKRAGLSTQYLLVTVKIASLGLTAIYVGSS